MELQQMRETALRLAKAQYATDDIEIDDNARLSVEPGGSGAWVAAWVWVEFDSEDAA